MHAKPEKSAPACRGFTLLETMLAVAILALIGTSIYRFTATTLLVARVGSSEAARQQACSGLQRFLQTQLDALPTQESDALNGLEKARTKEGNGDQMRLIATAGNGLLSRAGPATSFVTLQLGSPASATQLGVTRALREDRRGGFKDEFAWVPLLDGISDLKITYYSARLNGWLPRWNDPNALPELVRVRLSFEDGHGDFEMTLNVPVRGRSIVRLPVPPVDPRQSGTVVPTNPPPAPPSGPIPTLPPGLTAPTLPPGLQPPGGVPR